jgi:hypothetical protein
MPSRKRTQQRGDRTRPLDERVAAAKQRQRDADEDALRSGRLTPAEINRKNGLISGRGLKLNLTSGGRLRKR